MFLNMLMYLVSIPMDYIMFHAYSLTFLDIKFMSAGYILLLTQ